MELSQLPSTSFSTNNGWSNRDGISPSTSNISSTNNCNSLFILFNEVIVHLYMTLMSFYSYKMIFIVRYLSSTSHLVDLFASSSYTHWNIRNSEREREWEWEKETITKKGGKIDKWSSQNLNKSGRVVSTQVGIITSQAELSLLQVGLNRVFTFLSCRAESTRKVNSDKPSRIEKLTLASRAESGWPNTLTLPCPFEG